MDASLEAKFYALETEAKRPCLCPYRMTFSEARGFTDVETEGFLIERRYCLSCAAKLMFVRVEKEINDGVERLHGLLGSLDHLL